MTIRSLVLEVTADMLKDLGWAMVTAAQDALERLSENANIEILVTDVNMPGMDGYAVAQGQPPPGPDCK